MSLFAPLFVSPLAHPQHLAASRRGGGDCHALRGGDFDADTFFFVSERRGSAELERTRGGAESVFVLSY